MNENFDNQFEESETGNRGRTIFVIVFALGILVVAGVVMWTLLYAEPSTISAGTDDKANIVFTPAIMGGVITTLTAATRRRKGGASANYTIPSLIIGLVILLIVGLAMLVGFGVL